MNDPHPANTTRLAPLPRTGNAAFTQEVLESAGPGADLNLFRTFAAHPGLLRKFLPFGYKLLDGGSLDAQTRELAILRCAALVDCDYEVYHHRRIGTEAGLVPSQIDAAVNGDDHDWTDLQRAVLTAVNDLDTTGAIESATLNALEELLTDKQIIEVICLAGCYRMLAGILNTAGTPVERPQRRSAS